MKTITARITVFVCLGSLVFQGCAMNTPFVHDDLRVISSLKVVRHQPPDIYEIGGRLLVAYLLAGPIAVLVAAELTKEEARLDFGEFVMTKFVERVSKEIPNWPPMTVEEQPIGGDYTFTSGTLLEFEVTDLTLHWITGFEARVNATMKNSEDDVLWRKSFGYRSRDFDRQRSIDEFKADNAKLLKEEMKFAADKTVSDFIEHFKGEKKERHNGEKEMGSIP